MIILTSFYGNPVAVDPDRIEVMVGVDGGTNVYVREREDGFTVRETVHEILGKSAQYYEGWRTKL